MWYKRNARRLLVCLTLIGLSLSVITIVGSVFSMRAEAQADATKVFLKATDQQTGIQYGVGYDGGQINGAVIYDYGSRDGIQKYVAWNQRNVRQLLAGRPGPFSVLVVFNTVLPQTEFEQFVKTYALNVSAYSLRAASPNGTRSTVYGAPDGGNLIPGNFMNYVANDIRGRDGSEIRGWTDVTAAVDRPNLAKLINDPRVYTVDPTESILRENITLPKLSAAKADAQTIQGFIGGRVQIQMSRVPLFWSLEDLQLVH